MRQDSAIDRAFRVHLVNEDAIDSGGPYRELFENICTELMSADLPILVKSVNENGMLLNFEC